MLPKYLSLGTGNLVPDNTMHTLIMFIESLWKPDTFSLGLQRKPVCLASLVFITDVDMGVQSNTELNGYQIVSTLALMTITLCLDKARLWVGKAPSLNLQFLLYEMTLMKLGLDDVN